MAPGEAALLLPPPSRVQPPLPLQMQRLCLQPLYTGEHHSPPCPAALRDPAANRGAAHSTLGCCNTQCSKQLFSQEQQQLGSGIESWQLPASNRAAGLAAGSVLAGGLQAAIGDALPPWAPAGIGLLTWRSQELTAHWSAAGTFWPFGLGGFHFFLSFFPCFGRLLCITPLAPQRW